MLTRGEDRVGVRDNRSLGGSTAAPELLALLLLLAMSRARDGVVVVESPPLLARVDRPRLLTDAERGRPCALPSDEDEDLR